MEQRRCAVARATGSQHWPRGDRCETTRSAVAVARATGSQHWLRSRETAWTTEDDMFVGHYGPSFAIRAVRPEIPLWVLFIAAQLVDIAWATLVLAGIEKYASCPASRRRIRSTWIPRRTRTVSLRRSCGRSRRRSYAGSCFAGRAGVLLPGWGLPRHRTGRLIGWCIARISPLWQHREVGLGLRNYVGISLRARGGGAARWRVDVPGENERTHDSRPRWADGFRGADACGADRFAGRPLPPSPATVAASGLGVYLAFAAVAGWIDRRRVPVGGG